MCGRPEQCYYAYRKLFSKVYLKSVPLRRFPICFHVLFLYVFLFPWNTLYSLKNGRKQTDKQIWLPMATPFQWGHASPNHKSKHTYTSAIVDMLIVCRCVHLLSRCEGWRPPPPLPWLLLEKDRVQSIGQSYTPWVEETREREREYMEAQQRLPVFVFAKQAYRRREPTAI